MNCRRKPPEALTRLPPFASHGGQRQRPPQVRPRRSLVTARAVPAGQPLTAADLTWKRPAHGISPRNYDEVLGMRARRDLAEDTVLSWADLDRA